MTPREIDALVAEKIFHFKRSVRLKGSTEYATIYSDNPFFCDGSSTLYELEMYAMPKHYSTSIADAWTVVKKFQCPIFLCRAFNFSGNIVGWNVRIADIEGHAETAPMAICKAALAACGVQLE